jgi:hypothetical protein
LSTRRTTGSRISRSCPRFASPTTSHQGGFVAAEEYDDYGLFHRFLPPTQQVHQLYGVVDRGWKTWDIEGGVGVGLTHGSDTLTFKLILSRDLSK